MHANIQSVYICTARDTFGELKELVFDDSVFCCCAIKIRYHRAVVGGPADQAMAGLVLGHAIFYFKSS